MKVIQKNLIYARKLFNTKRVIIANLKNKEFENVPIAIYNSFQDKSYFDGNGELHLVAMLADIDMNGNSLYFNKIIKKLASNKMSYSEDFKIFVATIYGEAANCSEVTWKAVAHTIRNRIGFAN